MTDEPMHTALYRDADGRFVMGYVDTDRGPVLGVSDTDVPIGPDQRGGIVRDTRRHANRWSFRGTTDTRTIVDRLRSQQLDHRIDWDELGDR